jgi:isochorismate pyruvate lyase
MQAPQNSNERKPCQTLDEVRANIDRLDRIIVPLLAERESYVREAARFKPSAAAVVVPARVEEVVGKAREQARSLGASPEAMDRIYRAIIDAMTELEIAEHHQLKKG